MAVAIDIADGVKDVLNGGAFNPTFTAVRKLVPRLTAADLINLNVLVVPNSLTGSTFNRDDNLIEYQIDIGLLQKVSGDDDAVLLLGLSESIQDYLTDKSRRTIGNDLATLSPPFTSDPIFDRERYDQEKIFHSVTSFKYQTIR